MAPHQPPPPPGRARGAGQRPGSGASLGATVSFGDCSSMIVAMEMISMYTILHGGTDREPDSGLSAVAAHDPPARGDRPRSRAARPDARAIHAAGVAVRLHARWRTPEPTRAC